MIAAKGLRKRYGAHEALGGVDLDVRRGEVLAILGPNGAGKTTLIEILAGFRTRDAGELLVLGADPATAGRAWRERIGVVLQESEPDPRLTVSIGLWAAGGLVVALRRFRWTPQSRAT